MLVISTQNWSILAEFAPKKSSEIGCFYWLFLGEVSPRNFPWNRPIFPRICPWKSREILLFFFAKYQKPCSIYFIAGKCPLSEFSGSTPVSIDIRCRIHHFWVVVLALVVQTMNSTIHWTNLFPVDDDYENLLHYLLERNMMQGRI